MNKFDKKMHNVIITGCSSGIGRCVAEGLKEKGYRVFATARKKTDVDILIAEGFESVQLDLANSASIRSAFATILEKSGGEIYALFNNGAYGQPGAVEDLSRDVLRQQFEVNLFGTHELTNLVLPVMRKQGYGRIIHNSSVLGFVALQFRGAYNTTKYALEGLTDTLRLELVGTNIHISLIEPGPIESQFRKNALAAFEENISVENSPFENAYKKLVERLRTEGPVVPFTLGPEAVLDKVLHALESKKPKPRYYVTFPTYLFGYLKRALSTHMMDKVLKRV
jgi:NAD(P)-dependent dehydrogenase (short-subunit alcohol dehydrogenase family)